jgi:hypothetical protein
VVPKRGAGGDIETALGASIPAVDGDPAPGRGRVPQSLGQARQAGTFDRRTPGLAWLAWRGWLAQAGIEAQPGDDGQVRREVAQQGDGGEAAVGHGDDPPSRQPARDLQQHLARPVRQLLVPPPLPGGVPFRGRQHGQEG